MGSDCPALHWTPATNIGFGRGTGIADGLNMSRDHTKLRFFPIADELTLRVYQLSESLPASERYGLQSQMRRAAVSVVTNVVEGACRRTDRAYAQFLEIALGSASEVRYLLDLGIRLRLLKSEETKQMIADYSTVVKGLQALITAIGASDN